MRNLIRALRGKPVQLGYQLGRFIGGGLAPIIAVALLSSTGGTLAISAYTAAALVVTAVCVLLARETAGRDLDGLETPEVRAERRPRFARREEDARVTAGQRG